MSDQELLGLAAKAAGYQSCGMYEDGRIYLFGIQAPWSPLTCDGDALRLAVRLNIGVVQYAGIAPGFVRAGENIGYLITEPYGIDPYAATRHAIVRAAAEIGKAMP